MPAMLGIRVYALCYRDGRRSVRDHDEPSTATMPDSIVDPRRARRSPLAGRGGDLRLPSRVVARARRARHREHRDACAVARGRRRRALGRARRRRDGARGRAGSAGARAPASQRGRRPARGQRRAGARRRPTSSSTSIAAARARGSPTRCCGSATRQALDVSLAPATPRRLDVLRARGGRPLHAAGRRVGPAAPAARSGDAAFLLAVRRVLRRVHVLVQRPVRSARLDLLLGRRGRAWRCCRRCCCTSRWCSRSGRRGAPRRRAGCCCR